MRQSENMKTRSVAILVYPGAEVLDFAGPFEVFFTAGRLSERAGLPLPAFRPQLVAEHAGPVETRPGFTVTAASGLEDLQQPDLVIIPGGVHEPQLKNTPLIEGIRALYDGGSILASVCTGAFLLAEAGLLNGQSCTTHHEDIRDLQQRYPQLRTFENRRWVAAECGRIFTSAGISAGIDLSLHLVSRLAGGGLARITAENMAYGWDRGASPESEIT